MLHSDISIKDGSHIQWWFHNITSLSDIIAILICVSMLIDVGTKINIPTTLFSEIIPLLSIAWPYFILISYERALYHSQSFCVL